MTKKTWKAIASFKSLICEELNVKEVMKIQEMRKSAKLSYNDRIAVSIRSDGSLLKRALEEHASYIKEEVFAGTLTN